MLHGTRMPVDAIVDNFDYCVSVAEIAQPFEIPVNQTRTVLSYAEYHPITDFVR